MATWNDILDQARQDIGFTGDVVPRNLKGIRAALKPERLADLEVELSTLSEGAMFEAFLDDWWVQALADSASDAEERGLAIDFADVALARRAMRSGRSRRRSTPSLPTPSRRRAANSAEPSGGGYGLAVTAPSTALTAPVSRSRC